MAVSSTHACMSDLMQNRLANLRLVIQGHEMTRQTDPAMPMVGQPRTPPSPIKTKLPVIHPVNLHQLTGQRLHLGDIHTCSVAAHSKEEPEGAPLGGEGVEQ